jgi:hypothetical protein
MGKYILGYSNFVNESAGSAQTAADQIIAAAAKYIDVEGYQSKNYSTAERLSVLTNELSSQIRSEDGESAADEFVEMVMSISMDFVTEDSCPTCTEMMEPCDACKQHAAQMEDTDQA